MEENDYVSYELAIKLKKAGFDEPCREYYKPNKERHIVKNCALSPEIINNRYLDEINDGCCTAPSLHQAQKWLRKQGIEVVVEPRFSNYKLIGYDWMCYDDCSGDYALRAPLPFDDSYEHALSEGIKASVDLLKCNK